MIVMIKSGSRCGRGSYYPAIICTGRNKKARISGPWLQKNMPWIVKYQAVNRWGEGNGTGVFVDCPGICESFS